MDAVTAMGLLCSLGTPVEIKKPFPASMTRKGRSEARYAYHRRQPW